MMNTKNILYISTLATLALLFVSVPANAQVTGDLVEPNVLIMLDSSASMDWLRETGERPVDIEKDVWAAQVCQDSNNAVPLINVTDRTTSWEKVLTSFLGATGSNTYCSVEQPMMRPALDALPRDAWKGAGYLNTLDQYGNPEYIAEFRDRAHTRHVTCNPDYWEPQTAYSMGQCIKEPGDTDYDPDTDADGMTSFMTDGGQVYCKIADQDGSICWSYNPAAEDRTPNGILDRYSSQAKFGLMVYDNQPICTNGICTPVEAQWDYGDSRIWQHVTNTSGEARGSYWNAGARGDYPGAIGGLVRIGNRPEDSLNSVRTALESMEPVHCSPLGALIDDAGYYFSTDPTVLPKDYIALKGDPLVSAGIYTGEDAYFRCRPKIAVLITDGSPTKSLEIIAGTSTINNVEMDWHPGSIPPAVSDTPWRSSLEEAWEISKYSTNFLQSWLAAQGLTYDETKDEPVRLVVVGFNVVEDCADVDNECSIVGCTKTTSPWAERFLRCADCRCDPAIDPDCETKRKECIEYSPDYDKRCFIDECSAANPSYAFRDGGETAAAGNTCLMTPREFLNEIACHGWPYDVPQTGAGTTLTDTTVVPPWLDPIYAGTPDEVCSNPTATNLNPICTKTRGNSYDKTNPDFGDRALFVYDSKKLATVLDLVISGLTSTIATRTDVVTWDNPYSVKNSGGDLQRDQYEFSSGFVARHGRPWLGALSVTTGADGADYSCSGLPIQTRNIAGKLELQANRDLLAFDDVILDSNDYVQLSTNKEAWINGAKQTLVDLSGGDFDDCDFDSSIAMAMCTTKHVIQNAVMTLMEDRGLADIYNSTPAVIGPPSELSNIPSYLEFKQTSGVSDRSPAVLVGTNDGVLHSFDLQNVFDSTNDVEAWGYVPRVLVNQLLQQFPISVTMGASGYTVLSDDEVGVYQHLYLMDGSPITRDVLMFRDADSSTGTDESKYWKTVVFGGMGKGGKGYYALDITKATTYAVQDPEMLWELAPEANPSGMWGNNTAGDVDIQKMGYSISKPALAYVSYEYDATADPGQFAAAVLPGGWKPDKTESTGVYVVRMADGKVIRYLDPSNFGDTNNGGDYCVGSPELKHDGATFVESAQLVGEPAIPHGGIDAKVAKEAFIGDDRGRLWKLNMASTDEDKWCLDLYFDTLIAWHYPYQDCIADYSSDQCAADEDNYDDCYSGNAAGKECPVPDGDSDTDNDAPRNMSSPRVMMLGAPTIAEDESGNNVIIFGTGQYDELSSWNRNRIFSLTDVEDTDIAATSGIDTDDTEFYLRHNDAKPSVNWWIGDGPVTRSLESDAYLKMDSRLKKFHDKMKTTLVDPGYSGDGEFFNMGEKLIGKPTVFDEVVYFTTYLPIEDVNVLDACESGGSRIWAVDYNDINGADGIANNSTCDATNDFGFFSGVCSMFEWYEKQLLSGVRVVRRPNCDGDTTDVFEIVTQRATTNYSHKTSDPVPAGAMTRVKKTIEKEAGAKVAKVFFDSWSIVFD